MFIRGVFFVSIFIVFILSVINAGSIPTFKNFSLDADKIVHAIVFFILTYLGLLSRFNISKLTLSLLIFFFGLFIEIIHFFVPYRFFEYFDLLANLIGVTIAQLVYKLKS